MVFWLPINRQQIGTDAALGVPICFAGHAHILLGFCSTVFASTPLADTERGPRLGGAGAASGSTRSMPSSRQLRRCHAFVSCKHTRSAAPSHTAPPKPSATCGAGGALQLPALCSPARLPDCCWGLATAKQGLLSWEWRLGAHTSRGCRCQVPGGDGGGARLTWQVVPVTQSAPASPALPYVWFAKQRHEPSSPGACTHGRDHLFF